MTFEQNYSALDRILHRVAFASPMVQLAVADIESSLFGKRFRNISVEKPIFITSIPRAGTTLLLEVLSGSRELATHCYRDMPFVMAPMLWDSASRSFRKTADLKERAHGDGMLIGFDSPEAFEEILWRAFYPAKYKSDRILLWSADEDTEEFKEFFEAHMQKIIAIRSGSANQQARYLSKNNANVARLGLLKRLFPNSVIVIPFRRPVDQAVSLLKQHERFLAMHREDPFSRQYMNDIGHLEFGELHRPIAFDGIDQMVTRYSTDKLDYWIAYWVVAFQHILRNHEKDASFISYERFCERGAGGIQTLSSHIGLEVQDLPNPRGNELRAARAYSAADAEDKELLEQAERLHSELLARSIA